jgi:hypothetical protein
MTAIAKNATEEIRVTCVEIEGRSYMDIRIFEGKADKVPTKKGITLRMGQVPELIEVLQKERKEALAATGKKGIVMRPGLVPELIDALKKESLAAMDKEIERLTSSRESR